MASIRRTLSPVPRPGTSLNGEACSVPSPLSKSSSCNQNYPPAGGLMCYFGSLAYVLYRAQAFVLGVFSTRSSRSLERPKLNGHVWMRVLFHFFTCFVVGVFVGFAPLVSMHLSINLVSKHQIISFEVFPTAEKVHFHDAVTRNMAPSVDRSTIKDNATLGVISGEVRSEISNYTLLDQSLRQDPTMEFHKLLIIVTPTYPRSFQTYYLNRLARTLKLVPPPLLWIVVEMTSQSMETADILRRTGVMYRHLVCNENLTDMIDRGVHQRNVALSHIETHRLDGIIYFADDDNIYSADLFEQIRQIRRLGTWTVAKMLESQSKTILEGPICNGSQVIGWHTDDLTRRFKRFHAEMSGFAFNSSILWDPKRWHRPTLEPIRQLDTVKAGFQVSTFIEQLVEDESQMEGLPQDCSRIMVWHLHVESSCSHPHKWFMKDNLDGIAPLSLRF
ncbi:unnamed protein product [Ilex paraguariensis]|uniref:Glycosyltransferases n=1 Tax=Ilex paraguariensis TaxID=185542 RepID=A0ABC8T9K9_9AQUA